MLLHKDKHHCSFYCGVGTLIIVLILVMVWDEVLTSSGRKTSFMDFRSRESELMNRQRNYFVHSENETANANRKCKPQRFVFVKTHKTASSSASLTLQAFAKRQKFLTPVLFPYPFIGGYPGKINPKFVFYRDKLTREVKQHAPGRHSDVVMGHFRYNRQSITDIMGENFKTITIIRNPYDQVQSAFNYYYKKFKNPKKSFYTISCFGSPYLDVLNTMHQNISSFLQRMNSTQNMTSIPWYFRTSSVWNGAIWHLSIQIKEMLNKITFSLKTKSKNFAV